MSHPVPWDEGPYLLEDDSDRWQAEVGQEQEIEWGKRDSEMLEAHRQWVKKFNEEKEKVSAQDQ